MDNIAAQDFEKELLKPICLNLNSNLLVLNPSGYWTTRNTDIDKAAACIDELIGKLESSQEEVFALKQELQESNETKRVTLQMVKLLNHIYFYIISICVV